MMESWPCAEETANVSQESKKIPKVLPDITYHIGQTPMVRINNITKSEGVECEICKGSSSNYVTHTHNLKNEKDGPKDRIALRMIEDAERDGRLRPGMTIIEPTSGNTGIGLALVAAQKGYKCIIVMPDRMSGEKVDTLKALGAEIIRTPSAAPHDSPESNHSVAGRLNREIPNSILLNQYRNDGNSLAHYDQTAEEILDACDGHLDMFVTGGGTGGTISGVGRKLREKCPNCQIIGADPVGSIVGGPDEGLGGRKMELEGIGHNYIPTVLDQKIVDKWIKITDKHSFLMSRRLIREEGLLCGGTSGSHMWAAIEAAKSLKKGQKCVVLLPDGVRNYISPVTILPTVTCEDAVDIMDREAFDELPVVDETGKMLGIVTLANLLNQLRRSKISQSTPVEKATMQKTCTTVFLDTELNKASKSLDNNNFVMVVHKEKQCIIGVLCRMDLVKFITRKEMNRVESFESSGFSDSEQTNSTSD